ncbi:Stp1/IreP family PP2C-type Ser/Thr phosphatase [Paenibacillus lutrae]|uniref:Stp1/IreP family PP2C-type Ser/Thr phosphatase n=1 Tax=Paenibacillus lutrae TaxID=2078573 RepID=A0A7X3JYQ1_9BACL|nr:Stp1/IreP family PP2C-type Ser/Thr phosphatase [Paenibacillus lutrae]MVO99227.1 Stp1/IreP family PP2C-type Ser/Thr phosphatase [Paenibacillus lutrae]
MRMVSATDIGRVRSVNEDRAVFQQGIDGFSLAIVADGMGGHQAGDVASQMTIDMILEELQSLNAAMSVQECEEAVQEAIRQTNRKVFEYASGSDDLQGMGTTAVVLLASRQIAIVGHIGDSRAYKISGPSILRLTEDHSLVNELLKNGQLTPDEADRHPRRNVITRALGTEPDAQPDIQHLLWEEGDIILLCSDGLSGMVDDQTMLSIIRQGPDLETMAQGLLQAALDAGGDDNITLILIANEPEPASGGDEA